MKRSLDQCIAEKDQKFLSCRKGLAMVCLSLYSRGKLWSALVKKERLEEIIEGDCL